MDYILTESRGNLGLITLNRPQALNALNIEMVDAIEQALENFAQNAHIKTVVIVSASEKAFCAGGDVRAAYAAGRKDPLLSSAFFRAEYRLNYRIATYSKRLIALVDGLCFGGGMGLAVHAKHCIATERASFAMPEMAIGLFPDVGAAHFLTRKSLALANWMALTGARISQRDALYLKLATGACQSSDIPVFLKHLASGALFEDDPDDIPSRPSEAVPLDLINRCFSLPDPVAVMQQLGKEEGEWAHAQLKQLEQASPTSMAVTMRHLKQSVGEDLKNILITDFRIVSSFLREHDFYEGVRARLIDKDYKPHWQPVGDLEHYWGAPLGPDLFS